jgi:hypothetical protein
LGERSGFNGSFTLDEVIDATLPTKLGQRNSQVFEFARWLKAMPQYRDADPLDLEPEVRRWYERALPNLSTRSFEVTLGDFTRAWPRIKFPKGSCLLAELFARARSAQLPAAAMRYESREARELVGLCSELQRVAGDGPFYLSCRVAGAFLGIDHKSASSLLSLFQQQKILCLVSPGTMTGQRASQYRYLGDRAARP